MAKKVMKKSIKEDQNGVCALTGQELPEKTELFDTDRKTPKAQGGIYTDENTRVVKPRAHMKRHGNLRVLPLHLRKLKEIIDDRRQVMKLVMKVGNQIRAYQRGTDSLSETTLTFLKEHEKVLRDELNKRDKFLSKEMKEVAKQDKLAEAALKVKGVGPVSIAHLLVYCDLSGKRLLKDENGEVVLDKDNKYVLTEVDLARHASCLWAYVGLDKASHERYEKGKSGGGNKTLRTALFSMAESQVKSGGPYSKIYYQVKSRLEQSHKITKSRNTQGKLIECMWKDTKPSHRHGAALRAIMKHFLADYWYVGRSLLGLSTTPLYPESLLETGHRTILPEERGWNY